MISNRSFVEFAVADIPVDTMYINCNFMRRQPDTSGPQPVGVRLFPGDDTPRTFINCNLMNCEVPPGSSVVDCNTAIAAKQVPTVQDRIIVNGATVHTKQNLETVTYGKWTPEGYTYLPVEIRTPE